MNDNNGIVHVVLGNRTRRTCIKLQTSTREGRSNRIRNIGLELFQPFARMATDLGNGWMSALDPGGSGRYYYANTITGVTQWEYPTDL